MAFPSLVLAAVLSAALAVAAPGARANDSTGFLGTSGLVELTRTDAIEMRSERLEIGPERIRVDYVFRNVTAAPVETVVAFPFPDIDLSPGPTTANYGFPVRDTNFLGFSVSVDGKPVTPVLEQRALLGGRDVTAEVQQAGLMGVLPWLRDWGEAEIEKLPAPALARLAALGLIAEGEDGPHSPQWTWRFTYHWRQTFPPGRDLRVHHDYKPFDGGAIMGPLGEIDGRRYVGRYLGRETPVADRYCLDAGTRRALIARDQAGRRFGGSREIEYVLTTANNWRGPIGSFTLVLDKGRPDNVLSLCFDGTLRKTGPTTFEGTLRDFSPRRDLNILIFEASVAPTP